MAFSPARCVVYSQAELSVGQHTVTGLFTDPGYKSSSLSKHKLFKQRLE